MRFDTFLSQTLHVQHPHHGLDGHREPIAAGQYLWLSLPSSDAKSLTRSRLWGIGCLQLYLYYEKYWATDQRWLKIYLCLIWTLDTVHQVILLIWTYEVFVKGIIDSTFYIRFPKTASTTGIFAALVDVMVQIIFVRRAWYLNNKRFMLAGLLFVAVLGQFAMNVVYYGLIYNSNQLDQLAKSLDIVIALNAVIAFTDTFLASVLIWLLWKSRCGNRRTDSIINRLVLYTIGSGLVTSLWMILALVGVGAAPNSLIYALADLVLPKLYFNCVLASLNARLSLRTLGSHEESLSIRFQDFSVANARRKSSSMDASRKISSSGTIECRVDIDVESNADQRKVSIEFIRDAFRAFPMAEFHSYFSKLGVSFTESDIETAAPELRTV
ncbi:hypothetical protein ACEPAF_2233 [Sanghuangporus sanghuang]